MLNHIFKNHQTQIGKFIERLKATQARCFYFKEFFNAIRGSNFAQATKANRWYRWRNEWINDLLIVLMISMEMINLRIISLDFWLFLLFYNYHFIISDDINWHELVEEPPVI